MDIVIHVQNADERTFYSLERIWKDCPQITLPEAALAGNAALAGSPSAAGGPVGAASGAQARSLFPLQNGEGKAGEGL
jgi:ribosome-associated protein